MLEEKEEQNNNEQVQEIFSDYVMKDPEKKEEVIEPSIPNRPAHWSQRIAAGIIDICIIFMAIFGLYRLFVITALGNGMRDNFYEMQRIRDNYKLVALLPESDETIGYKLYETDPSFNDEKYKDYVIYNYGETPYKIVNFDSSTDALKQAYVNAVTNDQYYKNYSFNYRLCDFGVMALAAAVSETIFLFVVPLINKRRATLGKLAAGIQVIHYRYQIEATWYQMLGRFLWVYIIETVLPYLIISNALILALVVQPLMFVITLFTKDHRTIHDYISRTMVIDKRTFIRLTEQ